MTAKTAGGCAPPSLVCGVDRRRHGLRLKDLNGIDDIDVGAPDPADGSVTLCVHFVGPVPENVTPANICIDGGRRVRGIKVLAATPRPAVAEDDDDCLEVVLDRAGDQSTYELCIVGLDGFDPRYSCRCFTFTGHCRSDLDCLTPRVCPPEPGREPPIDYLVKDYAGFRRLILDRMALLVPAWRERHIPDVGITLVELLAYVADYLSYYQDAVATEAYLDTARLRVSVRRHGRLVDYVLHEGLNARAFMTLEVGAAVTWKPTDVVFLTAFPGVLPPGGPPLVAEELPPLHQASYRCFEPLVEDESTPLRFVPAHNRIRVHTWGDRECCLAKGATGASLVDDRGDEALELHVGDFLLFEEVVGPKTGAPGDADPTRRHVVRLTAVGQPARDPVEVVWVRDVEWAQADALPFPLCLSSIGPAPDCHLLVDVSVARGNVVLVDEGCRVTENLDPVPEPPAAVVCEGECQPAVVDPPRLRFRTSLDEPDLTFAEPLPGRDRCGRLAPAAALGGRDPHAGRPQVTLLAPGSGEVWMPSPDLLSAGPDDRTFVVEMTDEREAFLLFGDDRLGQLPPPGTSFQARYRVGTGPAGNVGAETIVQIALRNQRDDATVRVRNPLAATGGLVHEPVAEAKLRIPVAFRAVRERAVAAEDYAELAERAGGLRLQRATASLVWTGSWYEAQVALDTRGGASGGEGCACGGACQGCSGRCHDDAHEGHEDHDGCVSDDIEALVTADLERARRMGHELRVDLADTVPVDLQLTVCVRPDRLRAHVKAGLLDEFSARTLAGGRLGFFHPDRWTFGDSLHVSQILAAAHAVPGVESAEVTGLLRQGDADRGERQAGVLRVGPREVVFLANDPLQARSGKLDIVTRGGR